MTVRSRTLAARLLNRAATIVDGERRRQNGPPERSLTAIAASWEWYLQHRPSRPLEAADVATMLELLKIGRSICGEPLPDHFVDRAGYAALAGEAELLAVRKGDAEPNGAGHEPDNVESDDGDGEDGSAWSSDRQALEQAIGAMRYELLRAKFKHPPIRSAHEGCSIVREELDELWSEVKRQEPDRAAMRREAAQLAAMAIRFMLDVCPESETEGGEP